MKIEKILTDVTNADLIDGKFVIPNGVTSIGDRAFKYASDLTSVIIPDSVTSIGECAFRACERLKNITIPNRVTSIADDAFLGCDSLTSITIPDSVMNIGDSTFAWCGSLTNVTIPNSVASIGKGIFSECNNLQNINYGGTREQWEKLTHYKHIFSNGLFVGKEVNVCCIDEHTRKPSLDSLIQNAETQKSQDTVGKEKI